MFVSTPLNSDKSPTNTQGLPGVAINSTESVVWCSVYWMQFYCYYYIPACSSRILVPTQMTGHCIKDIEYHILFNKLNACLPVCSSIRPSVRLSVCLSVSLSLSLSVCLFLSVSVCLCLSVSLCLSTHSVNLFSFFCSFSNISGASKYNLACFFS